MWEKKKPELKSISNHFRGRKCVELSEFSSMFESYINEWFVNFCDVEDRVKSGRHISPLKVYSEKHNLDEKILRNIISGDISYIPEKLMNNMDIGRCKSKVPVVTYEESDVLVYLKVE